ncbi:hypothetical protein BU24DRAFT_403892 [Aaosphaeria arxii CBS 175.79]|uniref:MARVEL domain-containing protein n=1 Tax=Aaosphaeria arxii CBS 175.79 TaxID=1450172 RepID=A0A6A5Y7V5_9PLEO|nr:uncharacterized protein BU24DRAFT_403892 [Aaosphaeria arxii CBS 175.79]KAF2020821.1 hypothetical protein BU24DRAFT_403892 [Aaosphaeria arxii CBS 175.79]
MAKQSDKHGIVWKKRILVPLWIVRIIIMLFLIVVYSLAVKMIHDNHEEGLRAPGTGTVIVFMLFIVAVLLADVLAIVMFMRDALGPNTFLILNSFQTGFWTGVLILDFVAIGRGANAVGIGFTIFVYLTFLALFVYAIINYRRSKKHAQRGNYGPAHNPLAPTPGHQNAYAPPYAGATPYGQQNTAYASGGGSHELNQNPQQYYGNAPPYGGQFAGATQYGGGAGGAAGDYYHQEPAKPAHMV